MNPANDKLSKYRDEIDRIDQAILDLLRERNEIVHDVIETKIEHTLPVFVAGREDEKTAAFRKLAAERGIDADWAEDFLRMIMASSRAAQSVTRFPRSTEEPKTVLMVGGDGGMGSLYRRFLDASGHRTLTLEKGNWHELSSFAGIADMVIVSVPIRATSRVVTRLAPALRRDTVLADFTSNKREPLQHMLASHEGPVIGFHPMHGPDVPNLSKQLMVISPGRHPEASTWFTEQCRLWGMRILEADPQKHDHVMNLVQGLRHFLALLHGSFMRKYDLLPGEILDYSSPIYRAELMMTGRIFAQDAELYADIVFANDERRELLMNFLQHQEALMQMVKNNDKEGFIREFEQVTDFFGTFASQALEESGYLINRLSDRFTG